MTGQDRKRSALSFGIAAGLHAAIFGYFLLLHRTEPAAAAPVLDSQQLAELQFTDRDPVEEARQAELAEQQRQQELAEQQRQQEIAEQQRQQELAEQKRAEQRRRSEEKRIAEAKERQKREKEKEREREKQRQQAEKQKEKQRELAEKRRRDAERRAEQQRQAQAAAEAAARAEAARQAQAAAAAAARAAAARQAAAAAGAANAKAGKNLMDAYNRGLQAAIQRQVSRMGRARSTGTVTVTFNVSAGGSFSGIRVSRSSGNSELDQRAVDAVRSLGRYKAPPTGSQTFSVPIRFTLR